MGVKTQTIAYLSIASWNINGLGDKLKDDLFKKEISKHDIIFLLESHVATSDMDTIDGFHCTQVNHHKTKQNGKIDGGIIMLLKPHIIKGITIIDKSQQDYIWCKLDKHFFGLEKHIYICTAYLPPENSCYLIQRDQDILESIESDISKYSHDGYITLVGDLNARCSTISDHIRQDSNSNACYDDDDEHTYIIDTNIGTRYNQDPTVTNRGSKLTDLCVQCRIRILNGRTLGDTQGYFTCHRPQGSSTVDYMIISEELMHRVQYFHVHTKLDLSDHCKISMQIKCKFVKPGISENIAMSPMPHMYKWDENSIHSYQAALSTQDVQTKLEEFMNPSVNHCQINPDKAAKELNEIFHLAGNKALKKKQPPKLNTPQNKPWFNTNLKYMRQRVNQKGDLLTRFPNDPQIRGSYYKSLKEYNRERKTTQRRYKQDIVSKLDDLCERSPQQYWKLLRKLKNENNRSEAVDKISPSEWVSHFSKLNTNSFVPTNDIANSLHDPTDQKPNTELNQKIEEKETMKAIRNLKNGKATGLDGISNEQIKYGQHIFIKPLTVLYNMVLSSGIYPHIWANGYLVPIYKTGNPLSPDNYRGITINSCIGKVFNSILNTRLENYLSDNNIIHETQIGFRRKSRTSDHMFILRTLIDKTVKGDKKKLYACFVDFTKAFDSLPHCAILHKLKTNGITGPFLNIIRNMYQKSKVCVKVSGQLTPSFPAEAGVRQGDTLSPNIFKIYTNDLPKVLTDDSIETPKLFSKHIRCLLYADDLVILSNTKSSLQASLDKLNDYSAKWGLQVNINKTKIMIFNPQKAKLAEHFDIGSKRLECVFEYKYLGIIFCSSGSFEPAQTNLYQRSLKAYFKMSKMISSEHINTNTIIHLFDHMVKPIILYASEIWGTFDTNLRRVKNNPENKLEKGFEKLQAEKIQLKMCRYILGVNHKTSITAIRGETGRFPLYLEIITNQLKYLHYLANHSSELLKEAMITNQELYSQGKQCWFTSIQLLLNEIGLSTDRVKQPIGKWLHLARRNLQNRYISHWRKSLSKEKTTPTNNKGNKLRTYNKFKVAFGREPYLDIVVSKKLRSSLARLRTSSHKLHIETGRYLKKELHQRVCEMCNAGEVEDEQHFLTTCTAFSEERKVLYQTVLNHCSNFGNLNKENQMIWLMTAENPDIVHTVARYTHRCFQLRHEQVIK